MLTGELEGSYLYLEDFWHAMLFMTFLFLITIVLYNLLNALAVSDTQEIKRDAKVIDLMQRISTVHELEEKIFKQNSKVGEWLKRVISLFPDTLSEGSVSIRPNGGYRVIRKKEVPIVHNEWIPRQFVQLNCVKVDMKFKADVIEGIQALLAERQEQQHRESLEMLREKRNQKLANDIAKIYKILNEMQSNQI